MTLPEPLTPEQLATYSGQIAAIYIISLTLQHILPSLPTRYVAFFTAIILSFLVNPPASITAAIVNLVNGLLAFLTVIGASASIPSDRFHNLRLGS